MQSIADKIMINVKHKGRGYIFTPKDFLDIGSRQSIDTSLSRLHNKGLIRRLARGLYDYPINNPIIGELLPSIDSVAKAIAKEADIDLQITGAKAVHLLGLTTQVPVKVVYLTNGNTKSIKIGNTTLSLKHVGTKIMAGSGKLSGAVLQAIRYLGKDKLSSCIISKIKKQLTTNDKIELAMIKRNAPDWSRSTINQIIN